MIAAHLHLIEDQAEGLLVGQDWPLVPDGEYVAVVKHWETAHIFRGAKLYLHLKIVGGTHDGCHLFSAFTVRQLIGKSRKFGGFKAARRSKLIQTLARITGQRLRGDRVSLRWLTHVLLRIKTRTVTHDHAQKELPPALRYSIVADLVAVEAGKP